MQRADSTAPSLSELRTLMDYRSYVLFLFIVVKPPTPVLLHLLSTSSPKCPVFPFRRKKNTFEIVNSFPGRD